MSGGGGDCQLGLPFHVVFLKGEQPAFFHMTTELQNDERKIPGSVVTRFVSWPSSFQQHTMGQNKSKGQPDSKGEDMADSYWDGL